MPQCPIAGDANVFAYYVRIADRLFREDRDRAKAVTINNAIEIYYRFIIFK